MKEEHLIVTEEKEGLRVDVFVTQALPDLVPSRMFVKRLAESGRLTVNGASIRASHKVLTGDKIHLQVLPADFPDERILPEDVALDIVYEDDDLIALNKPCGMSVHPAAGFYGGTLVSALVQYSKFLSDVNGGKRPGIVHRLDKETSGVLLVVKNNTAHARLAQQFEEHTIEKKYVALVEGEVQYDEGLIEAEIGAHARYHDLRRIVPEGEGKKSETSYAVIKRSKAWTAIALYPTTGRTHQLRLHMKHIGHPIMGDDKYGRKETFSRLALHAQAIFFQHPLSGTPMEISVPLPSEFQSYFTS